MRIKGIKARIVFSTKSKPTIEIEIETSKGKVKASTPIGTSKGRFEAEEIKPKTGILKFEKFKSIFLNKDFEDIKEVDTLLHILDKTENFKEIGGNLAIAISSAFLKAFALEAEKEVFEYLGKKKIPLPLCNVIGSWKKFSGFQEYLLYPKYQKSFFDSIEKISNAYLEIGKILQEKDPNFKFGKNLESAWITNLKIERILEILSEIAKQFNLKIGVDVAANNFFDGKYYVYKNEKLNRVEQLSFLEDLVKRFKISYLEDPFEENDITSFSALQADLPSCLICGDDLYATNIKRLRIGIDLKATKAVIIKPNQVGTISNTINFFKEAKKNDIKTVLSHRSGETDDNLICHLAVGLGSDFIKIGISGERVFKINEMIRIEEIINR